MAALVASCSTLPFDRQMPYVIVNRKNCNCYQCFCFLLISPGLQGERSQKKPQQNNPLKTSQRTGKCFQVIVSFIPDLSLSVIQEWQGTPKHRQPLAGEVLTDISFSCCLHLESASPSSCCPSFGTCWLSGTLQCSCSTTAWFQSHQAHSGFPNRICYSVLFVQGYVVNGK